jgi:tetraacyldisaccharide 4'-kinase
MTHAPWAGPRKVGAFCGIGSPASFWRTLDEMELEVVYREAFRDHHAYSAEEIAGIDRMARAAGAEALVTTEKDLMNVPEGLLVLHDIRCVYIAVEIDNEEALMAIVRGYE